jgi:uncharacterized membrane protein
MTDLAPEPPVTELTDVPLGVVTTPSDAEKKRSRKDLERERDEQNNRWRRILFATTIVVVALCVVASIGGGFLYMIYMHMMGRESNAAVLSTWFGANVVQVVGVLLVITRHLFPGTNQTDNPKRRLTVSVK